ncbi:hypothetical protein VYU27_002887 [Nannochloropsis oceanica]
MSSSSLPPDSSSPSPPRRSARLAAANPYSASVSNSDSSESSSSSSSSSIASSSSSSSFSSSSINSSPSSPPCPTPRDAPPMLDDKAYTLLPPPFLPSSGKFNMNHLFYRETHGAGNLGPHHRFVRAALNGVNLHPTSLAGAVGGFQSALFSASFSRDGQMVFTACQDGTINLYDLDQLLYAQAQHQHRLSLPMAGGRSAPRMYSGLFSSISSSSSSSSSSAHPVIRPKKRIRCQDIGWSIVGSAFSPDAKWIAYSSWSRYLHLTNTFGQHELHERVSVSPHRSANFCLFSLAFSADGAQVIGGGNDGCLHLIQLERKAVSRIEQAHYDDVNTVCFVDPVHSPSLVLSGADDGLIKLWDLRTEGAVGLLAGHTSGITNVCSKDGGGGGGGGRGGGRLVVSNGKDQTSKLWDLRKMVEAGRGAEERYAVDVDVDYRFDIAEQPLGGRRGRRQRHPVSDHSIKTWWGHRVTRTLIQATFSSEELTGGRFVVTGSAGGGVFVYDIMGEGAGEGEREREGGCALARLDFHKDCVRTVACAPHHDLMISAGWDGRLGLWCWQGREDEEEA